MGPAGRRRLACMGMLAACAACAAPTRTPDPALAWARARLADAGPDIAILHPPDGFLVDDPARLMVAFYVSSFCVARLGDELEVGLCWQSVHASRHLGLAWRGCISSCPAVMRAGRVLGPQRRDGVTRAPLCARQRREVGLVAHLRSDDRARVENDC